MTFYESENMRNHDFINQTILSKLNPFPMNPVTSKDNLPQFCLGRTEEVGIIKNAIEKVANHPGNKSTWIPINGDGGTGKSTIALYIYNKIRSGNSSDLDVDYLETAYINIPADPKYLTIEYIYKKVVEDLGESPESYPYFLGFNFVKKICALIKNTAEIKEEFNRKFQTVWSKLILCNDFKELLIKIKKETPKFTDELSEFITEYDYIIEPQIKLPINFMQTLVQTTSENKKVRRSSCQDILGVNIKDGVEARYRFENLIKTINFLFNRSCLFIIMDNLENLGYNEKTFREFFTFILAFRNNINSCLLLTIGSTKFWEAFRKSISMSEWNMLEGFKFEELTLMNLSEEDASRILTRHMEEFWKSYGLDFRPIGKDRYYPFSKSAFKYMYEMHDRNIRDTIKNCNRIVEKYKESKQIVYYSNIETAIYNLRKPLTEVYLFENELNYMFKFLDKFSDRNNLSRKVENGLIKAFNEIKSHQDKKYISNVEHEPSIKLFDGKICKPDVYLTLYGQQAIEDIKHVEFQVKMAYPSNHINYSDVKSSIDLIKEGKNDYLTFITLSPLEGKIIQELNDFKGHIGRVMPLEQEEPAYLMLLLPEFSKLFFHVDTLTTDNYIQILDKIGIEFPKIFEIVKDVPKIEPIKPSLKVPQEPIPTTIPPKTPLQKIYNPKELESHIIEHFVKHKLLKNKNEIISAMEGIAGSTSVINSALSNLQKLNKLTYSRKTPQGWSLIE